MPCISHQADDDNDEDLFAAISSAHSTAATINFGAGALGQGLAPGLGQGLGNAPGPGLESPLSPLSRKMSRASHQANSGPTGLIADASPLLTSDGTDTLSTDILTSDQIPILLIPSLRPLTNFNPPLILIHPLILSYSHTDTPSDNDTPSHTLILSY